MPARANLSGEERIQTGRPHIPGHRDDFPYTAPVGSFPQDANGLFDLHGNVWEWTLNAGKEDSKSGVLRGRGYDASLNEPSWMLAQSHHWADAKGEGDGFRCVLELPATSATGQQATPASASIPASILPTGSSASTLTTSTKEKPFINSLGMKFVPVPGTKVLFCIHETRRQDYEIYAQNMPGVDESWKNLSADDFALTIRPEDHPVGSVSWEDAQKFCAWLGEKEGNKYRLPTDEEWSHAVGTGNEEKWDEDTTPATVFKNQTSFPWGDIWPPPKGSGNYSDESRKAKAPTAAAKYLENYDDGFPTTAPVMSFKPNKLGLYDMEGNVREWVEDWYDNTKKNRVIRGGWWHDYFPGFMWSSTRHRYPPGVRYNRSGFRCVMVVVE